MVSVLGCTHIVPILNSKIIPPLFRSLPKTLLAYTKRIQYKEHASFDGVRAGMKWFQISFRFTGLPAKWHRIGKHFAVTQDLFPPG